MKLSVVIPSRGDKHNLETIIKCFETQTLKDFEVIFVVDQHIITSGNFFTNRSNIKFITNLNSNFIPDQGVSYVRNFGIDVAEGDFINLMDDDERLPPDYLQKSLDYRYQYRQELNRDFVLAPTLMYRKTHHIQSQGFSYFNYWLSRPIPQKLGHRERAYIQMYSGNSLLAPAHIFRKIRFDEKMDFVYEDLDFTYRIHKAGIPLIVLRDLKIYHMERDKTPLEKARIGHELQAYKKSKHRVIFVKKNGNLLQKMEFWLFGFRAQPLRLLGKILRYAKGSEKFKNLRGLRRGMAKGVRG